MCLIRPISMVVAILPFFVPSDPVLFPVADLPYDEGFDASSTLPQGWGSTRIRHPMEDDAAVTVSSPRSAPHCVILTNATLPQALVSRPVGSPGWTLRRLSFYTRRSSSFLAIVVVECSPDGVSAYRVLDSLRADGSAVYVQSSVSLAGLPVKDGTTVFRWRVIPDSTGSIGTFRIDDISVTGVPAKDLELASMTVDPPWPVVSQPSGIGVTIRNSGYEVVGRFGIELFLDIDADSCDDEEERLMTLHAGPLAPGDSSIHRFEWLPERVGIQRISGYVVCEGDGNTSNDRRILWVRVGVARGSIVINEIMFAPSGEEPEWVELMNTSEVPVSLSGWSVSDAIVTNKHGIPASSAAIPAGGFAVLTKDSVALVDSRGPVPGSVLAVPGFPSLNNTGDAVIVYDEGGRVMDSVLYSPGWGALTGASLERKDPFASPLQWQNWCSSTDSTGATPGWPNASRVLEYDLSAGALAVFRLNENGRVMIRWCIRNSGRRQADSVSVEFRDVPKGTSGPATLLARLDLDQAPMPGDSTSVEWQWDDAPPGTHQIVATLIWAKDQRPTDNRSAGILWVAYALAPLRINEIMASPLPGDAEYVELVNVAATAVEVGGWRVNGHPLGLREGSCLLASGGFVVVGSDSAIYRRFQWLATGSADLRVFVVGQTLGLNNEGDSIVVRDPDGGIGDSLWYDSRWHNPAITDQAGRSLEKILRSGVTTDGRNWSTCVTTLGGTPGRRNSVTAGESPRTASLSCTPNPFSPDADGQEDFVVLRFTLPGGVSLANVTIYDTRGRLVRHLVAGQASGPEGEVVWDGYDDRRQGLPLGPYIAVLEAMDHTGSTMMKAKCLVVLARNL